MSTSLVDTQITTELYFNKKAVFNRIEEDITREDELLDCMFKATVSITNWAMTFNEYPQKKQRLNYFYLNNDISELVKRAMVLVMMLDDRDDLLTSIAGQLASAIKGLDSYRDQVITAGEILTLMCDDNCFDLNHRSWQQTDEETGVVFTTNSWIVSNPWELSRATKTHIKRAMYLPPMVTKPKPLLNNRSSAYLTIDNDSVILGKQNYHNGNVCLSSLNRFNNIPLAISIDFIKHIDKLMEDETVDMTQESKLQYEKFMSDSMYVFAYLVKAGNKFYLSHKTDKRGRTYAQGYHASTQGNALRKAAIELATKQEVYGEFTKM